MPNIDAVVLPVAINYWNFDLQSVDLLVATLTFIATSFFGIWVFARDIENWTNRLFFLLALIFDAYIAVNYLSLHPPGGALGDQLFWIRMVMVVASFKGTLLFLLVHTFPGRVITLRRRHLVALLLALAAALFASATPLVFTSLSFTGNEPVPVPGPGIPIFFLNFVVPILSSIGLLVVRIRRARGEERDQLKALAFGIVVSFSLIALTSLVFVVILRTSSLVFLGPVFLTMLIGAVGYAIARYRMFNIKVVATNVLVAVTLMIFAAEVFMSRTYTEVIKNSLILILGVIFGTLLARSVRREVEQRERLLELSQNLAAANKRLADLNRMKSEFLSFASHQIKGPLAIIKDFAALLMNGDYGAMPAEAGGPLKQIKESARRLIELTNNFLDLRKIDEGRIEYQFAPVDIVSLVKDLVREFSVLAREKGLSLELRSPDESVTVSADEQRIRQAIQNLIDNAIKYTDAGRVNVVVARTEGKVLISVSDSGRGISPQVLPTLFEQFTRDPRLKNVAGTGLGLYIGEQIVRAHKGRIWAESAGDGKGSTFFIELPLI